MSLPIKLSVTGLLFTGEVAVAYEGHRKRVHLCILDDLDPYGPASASTRPKREPEFDESPIPPPVPPPLSTQDRDPSDETDTYTYPYPNIPGKPPPVGHRLLPVISIDSEIGQADKHALKNVTRIERFIQDVVRRTVEEELVFPNFHTVVLGDV
jgi:distribution and morphology protein 12